MENIETDEYAALHALYRDCPIPIRKYLRHGTTILAENEKAGFDYEIGEEEMKAENNKDEEDGYFGKEVFDHLSPDALGDEDNGSDSEDLSPFEKLKKKMKDITPDGQGGVWKMVVNEGTGPVIPQENRAEVHYNSYLEYNDEPMDSTRLRNETKKFILGRGDVIEGMELAVSTMKKGELSKFLISPDLAFGRQGCGQRIPPNAEILMEIELVSFASKPSPEDVEEAFKKVRIDKEEGNRLFKQREYHKAEVKYCKAQKFLNSVRLRDEEDEKEMERLMLKLCLNIALTSLKLGKGSHVISQSRRALDISPNNDKALYRLAKGYRLVKEFDKAEYFLGVASKHCPNDHHINVEKQELAKAKREFKLLEVESYSRMFKDMNINDQKPEQKTKPTSQSSGTTPEFEAAVSENLKKFIEQPDCEEMPTFQLNQMSESEKLFVEKKAKVLGLEARYVEKMGEKCLRIAKIQNPDE